nr:alcohol dehydrogenase catalytic domain-containing protein [Micromonospora sp. DSM 115978]
MTEPRHVEVVDDWPEPQAGVGEVVVAMRALGLCGSDLSVYDGHLSLPSTPWVMGHEGGGEIVAVGDGVTDRQVGQRVVVEPNYCCLTCRACRAGLTSECPNRRIVGINVPGLFAERVAVPARFTWPVPASVPDEALACVEPFAVAQAGLRRAGIGLRGAAAAVGSSDVPTGAGAGAEVACLVVGAGSQGLLMCQALLAVGVRPHVVEPHEGRRALAQQIGA